MKDYTLIIAHLNAVIAQADRCKKAYYWTPGKNASARRYNEEQNNIAPLTIEDVNGDTWTVGYTYRETCSNVYASGHYYRNGQKTTLTAVKNLLKRLSAERGAA